MNVLPVYWSRRFVFFVTLKASLLEGVSNAPVSGEVHRKKFWRKNTEGSDTSAIFPQTWLIITELWRSIGIQRKSRYRDHNCLHHTWDETVYLLEGLTCRTIQVNHLLGEADNLSVGYHLCLTSRDLVYVIWPWLSVPVHPPHCQQQTCVSTNQEADILQRQMSFNLCMWLREEWESS